MVQRNAQDFCLLCINKLADKTGSHYTPAGIIKNVIGRRDYEETYSVTADEANTSKFMGRSNLKNTNTSIQKPEHIEDHIFCRYCEERLGVLESICHPALDKLLDDLIDKKTQFKKTPHFNCYIDIPKVHPKIMLIYFYSVIWRQALQQQLKLGTTIFNPQFMENLRKIIHTEIYKSTTEITDKDMSQYPPISLLCKSLYTDPSACFINPNTTSSNPQLFYVGPFNILIWQTLNETPAFKKATGLNDSWKDKSLWLTGTTRSVVGVLAETAWQKCTGNMLKKEAAKYNNAMVKKIQVATSTR